jgi:hypothetical protein
MRVLVLPILFGVMCWLCYVAAAPRRRKER